VSRRILRLVRDGFPEPAARDTAVSHAILRRVSNGELPETIRLHRPSAIVAFGPVDRHAAEFREAVAAARALGYEAILRLAGGRAAVFHQDTLAFSWVVPDPAPRLRIVERFEWLASRLAEAFRDLGVDARVGEVAGEYCPGEYSVNARGRVKVMGVGQRLVLRAAHVGGVVVVAGGDRVRDVLTPVYRALGIEWDPATAGSLAAEARGITWEAATDAVIARLTAEVDLVEDHVDARTLALARDLESRHAIPPDGQPGSQASSAGQS
jgi:octanoyl-[GcvH]:protein N-octanoyltransferase